MRSEPPRTMRRVDMSAGIDMARCASAPPALDDDLDKFLEDLVASQMREPPARTLVRDTSSQSRTRLFCPRPNRPPGSVSFAVN